MGKKVSVDRELKGASGTIRFCVPSQKFYRVISQRLKGRPDLSRIQHIAINSISMVPQFYTCVFTFFHSGFF